MTFNVQYSADGETVDSFDSYVEAELAVEAFEQEDKENGVFIDYFYEIVPGE